MCPLCETWECLAGEIHKRGRNRRIASNANVVETPSAGKVLRSSAGKDERKIGCFEGIDIHSHADLIRTIITKYGGQWAATPTENITHLIADTAPVLDSALPSHFNPIVVSYEWIRDSLEQDSRWDITPYVLRKRSSDGSSTFPRPTSSADPKAKHTALAFQHPLPFLPFEIIGKIHLIVSQVCRRWQVIAHDNVPLWTHIFLDFPTKKVYTCLSKMAEVGWIARSGSHLLSVNIRSFYPRVPNPAINFLVAHRLRIRELLLRLPAAQFLTFFQITPNSFPLLETITLSVIPKTSMEFNPGLGMT
ncbi:hypothetical protein DFH07DRAFT_780909 [Mycena maculata]|uniref:BRCT domain-containing protein n=1 Tax=Mycena maculata TaxID=230809 RepID=A0AAD7I0Y4_9AGAR|nr:hypothetical protein DFH07DRAFT_780909 [Mycena maculata]